MPAIAPLRAGGNADEIEDQEEIGIGVGLVRILIPQEREPDDQTEEQCTGGKDLRFNSVEPERIAEGKRKSADGCGEEGCERGCRSVGAGGHEPPNDFHCSQVEEQDCKRTGDGRQAVDPETDVVGKGDLGEDSPEQKGKRGAGGVRHLQQIGGGGDLAGIPEGD